MLNIKRMISLYNHYKGNSIKYIVVHGTGAPRGTDTALDNATYFSDGNRGASAHYFVDSKDIYQSVEDFNGAWHVGDGANAYGINNQNSLGVEMCCTNFDYAAETVKNTIELVKYLQAKYNVPDERVVRHYDASRKVCPAYFASNNWGKWNEFKNAIAGIGFIPTPEDKPIVNSKDKYINLLPHMSKWNVYPMNKKPVIGNECGQLKPGKFGGLSYKIIEDRGDVKVINTGDFGTVQIYAPRDNDSTITDKPTYNNGNPISPSIPVSNKKYLNLHPHMSKWNVYTLNVAPVTGNQCGALAPAYYGGLSYEILEDRGDVKIINTSTFGKVQIYAPRDNDSSITENPIY